MKELIENLRIEIVKCEILRRKEKITELEKKYIDGMIDAYNRCIFNIEINYLQ